MPPCSEEVWGLRAEGELWLMAHGRTCPSFLVSVLYSKAKLASACGGIIYFLSYVPYMYVAIREEVAHDKITAFEKCIAVRSRVGSRWGRRPAFLRLTLLPPQSLMSTTAFGLGSKYFALYEVAGVGIQWHTFSQSPVEGDDFNLLLAVTMLMVDAAVYGVLTWYIEAVHPGAGQTLGGVGASDSLWEDTWPGMDSHPRPWDQPPLPSPTPRNVWAAPALVLPTAEVLLAGQWADRGMGVELAMGSRPPAQRHGGRPGLCHGEQALG